MYISWFDCDAEFSFARDGKKIRICCDEKEAGFFAEVSIDPTVLKKALDFLMEGEQNG